MIAALELLDAYYQARRNVRGLRGDALVAHQDRRARAMVDYAVRHSPFYRRHFAGHDATRWRTLPTLDKALMMAEFGEANTCGISREVAMDIALTAERTRDFRPTAGGVTVGVSSGTSGHRTLFLATRGEQARWVGSVLARLLPPLRRRGFTITLFSLSGSNLYDDLRGRWLRFHHHDVATPIGEAVRLLNGEQPDLLCGPPQYLRMLAERRLAGELKVSPQRLISVADVLEPHVEALLARAFGCPVAQIYQSSEGLIGISCAHGRLHVQEDLMAVQFEPLTESDSLEVQRHTPIITDLGHRSLPIIRYRMQDIVTLAAEPCACGSHFQVLESVEGRNDDVCDFVTVDGGRHPVFPATIRRMVLLASHDIADYDAVQERPSHLRVRVAATTGSATAVVVSQVRESLAAGLAAQGVVDADIEVVAEPPVSGGFKRRRVRRAHSPAEGLTHVG